MEHSQSFPSPVGTLYITSNGSAVTSVSTKAPVGQTAGPDSLTQQAVKQLGEYFEGVRRTFELPLHIDGTPFQRKVWDCLCEIPYGSTISYGELAARAGNPKACRAVGMANNRNRHMIVIPCHRVIGADGSLTGYAGGTEAKRYLFELEGVEPY